MIEGVAVKPIHVIADERGRVIEILRSDDPLFERFGQVFVSTAYPGVVKAWRRHRRQTSFVAVKVTQWERDMRYRLTVKGSAGFIVWDTRQHKIGFWVKGSRANAEAATEAMNTIDKIEMQQERRKFEVMELIGEVQDA